MEYLLCSKVVEKYIETDNEIKWHLIKALTIWKSNGIWSDEIHYKGSLTESMRATPGGNFVSGFSWMNNDVQHIKVTLDKIYAVFMAFKKLKKWYINTGSQSFSVSDDPEK